MLSTFAMGKFQISIFAKGETSTVKFLYLNMGISVPSNCFYKIEYLSRSYFPITVLEKRPVNDKMASNKENERLKGS